MRGVIGGKSPVRIIGALRYGDLRAESGSGRCHFCLLSVDGTHGIDRLGSSHCEKSKDFAVCLLFNHASQQQGYTLCQ